MNSTRWTERALLVTAAAGGLWAMPARADAQFVDRLALHGEFGGGAVVSESQRARDFNLALGGGIRPGIEIVGPLSFQVALAGHWMPSPWGNSNFLSVGGGLRLEPQLGRFGWFFVDVDGGFGWTHGEGRPMLDAGLGLEINVSRHVALGPFARFSMAFKNSDDISDSPMFVTAGLALAWHGRAAYEDAPPPPADTDGDGVPDPTDLCPTQPRGEHPDPARLGCPATDADGDGIFDADDVCPNEPAGSHPDAARRGCPVGDADHDGVLDDADQCVQEPQGDHPNPERAGCPDGDADHDRVLDHADACPNEPSGLLPDPQRPGCPLADRDHDSVPDATDHCPDQPGAPSTDPNRNGCPGLVQVQAGQIQIMQPVFFATARDRILARSNRILTAVREAIAATPTIRHVSIEGHTDNAGTPDGNMDLSQRRANSVMRWLVEHGIAADRLEAHGFGQTRPIASNDTSAGRASNRRVEFRILADGN